MKTNFFTGQGDKGESAFGKKKLSKDSVLFELLGDLDELNSWVGFARVEAIPQAPQSVGSLPITPHFLDAHEECAFEGGVGEDDYAARVASCLALACRAACKAARIVRPAAVS